MTPDGEALSLATTLFRSLQRLAVRVRLAKSRSRRDHDGSSGEVCPIGTVF